MQAASMVDHPCVTEEIERLHRDGIPTLLSDLSASLRAG
jgi:hypothetical protein